MHSLPCPLLKANLTSALFSSVGSGDNCLELFLRGRWAVRHHPASKVDCGTTYNIHSRHEEPISTVIHQVSNAHRRVGWGQKRHKQVYCTTPTSPLSHSFTYPVFVIHNITQHVIHIQNAPISMFQSVNLDPVAGVLEGKKQKVLAL